MTTAQGWILGAIVGYLALMLLIGVLCSRKKGSGSSDHFYLGGRSLGPIVTAMSAEASDMSSYLLMGLPGLAYLTGMAEVGWTIVGLALGTWLNWFLVARRLRRDSARLGAITIPDYFSRRYGDEKKRLACAAALIILLFFIPYTASGFKALGTLFSSLFGWDYHTCMLLGGAVVVLYTVMGGFLAVSVTDLVQSIVMTAALAAVVVFGIRQAGGMEAVLDNARALPGYLSLTQGYDPATGSAGHFGSLSILSTLAWGLGYFGMPHILLRFMAIRDENELKLSRRVASIWVALSMAIAVGIGVIGLSLSAQGKLPVLSTAAESETVVISLADLMSRSGHLAAILAGIVLAGILAATMSTADSQLLAAASSVSQDLLGGFFHLRMKEKTVLRTARLTVLGVALVGAALAWDPDSSVFRVVSFAWAGFGAAFGPAILLALFDKKSTGAGCLAGMLAGGAGVILWKFLLRPLGGAWDVYELLPAFILALLVNVLVSRLAGEKARAAR